MAYIEKPTKTTIRSTHVETDAVFVAGHSRMLHPYVVRLIMSLSISTPSFPFFKTTLVIRAQIGRFFQEGFEKENENKLCDLVGLIWVLAAYRGFKGFRQVQFLFQRRLH